MTEAEWLMPGDLRPHVEFQAARQQARRLRLFSVACCRQLEPWMDEPKLFEALARAERVADGELSDSTIAKWRRKVSQLERDRLKGRGTTWTPQMAVYHHVATACLEGQYLGYRDNWRALVYHGQVFGDEFVRRGPHLAHALLLDIFGNPFRPVAFSASWRTDTAAALARQMYESRDFGAMPILADALQDAGCDSEDILAHCRDASLAHVRGCWVVDLVLDKG
jgi:hypothetical protein